MRRQIVRLAVVQDDPATLEIDWLEIDWEGVPSSDLSGMPAGKRVSLSGATFITLAISF